MAAPVVNINTANAFGLTLIDNADATTGWSGFRHTGGGSPSPVNETDVFLQGTAAVSIKVTSAGARDEGVWFDTTTGVDMTVTGRHLYIWAAMTTALGLNTIANGGLYIIVASDAAGNNWNKYYVGGSDRIGSEFIRYVIDLNKTPSETAATAATLTSIRWFGVGVKSTAMTSKSENLIVDRMDYGDGLQIEEGDASNGFASWASLFAADDNISNKYGIVENRSGIYFLKGGLTIGDPTGTVSTIWNDPSGAQVRYENPLYHNGTALVSAIDAANLYRIDFEGNATGTTDIDFGLVVGTGDSRQGILGGSISSDGPKFEIDGETDIADLDSVNLYGLTIEGAGLTRFSSSTKTDIIGCTFVACDEVQPNDAEFLNNTIVGPVPDRGLEMVSTHNIKQVGFVAAEDVSQFVERVWQVDVSPTPDAYVEFTDEFASAATGDVNPWPATEAAGDMFLIGSRSKFGAVSIDVGTAGVGGTMLVRYWNGSAWTTLSGVTDNTSNLTTAGVNTITFTVPTDWAALSANGESPLFYISLEVATTYSTNPVLDEGFVDEIVEHHLHIPATGTYAADALEFFGHGASGAPKWHGENSSAGLVTINASNGANPVAAEFENTGGGSIAVNNTVNLTVTVEDRAGVAVQDARVSIELSASPFTQLMNELTTALGVATESFNYTVDQGIIIRVRKSTPPVQRYEFFETTGTITVDGFTLTAVLDEDTIASPT